MELEVGTVVEGKVTGITKFGAFVALPGGKSGLVHISELANTFVTDVNDYVQIGQTLKVKVLGISPEGKINLSVKRAAEAVPAPRTPSSGGPGRSGRITNAQPPVAQELHAPTADQSFEDRLKKFMQESDSRIADNRMYADRSRGRRRH